MKKIFIIAEAGVNHNGQLSLAKKLVERAKEAGADAVKFQTFQAEKLVSKRALLAPYQKKRSGRRARNQFDLLKGLELSFDDFVELKNYCDQKRILFLSTPFDFESTDLLVALEVRLLKIGSGEVTNLPFLTYVAKTRKRILLSTGMSNLKEVGEAVAAIRSTGNRDLVLLHSVTEYPAPVEDVNLLAMLTLAREFRVPVGYSDHTLGIEIALAAAALGADVIEKHFTLSRKMKGPDHRASLEPEEFKKMVAGIRSIEKSLGNGVKRPAQSEKKNIPVVRRSLIAADDIRKGELVREKDIVIKRPGYGIPPRDLEKVIGSKARTDIPKDEVIEWHQLESKKEEFAL